MHSLTNQRKSIRNVHQGGVTISILTLMLSSFERYRTCVYEIEGDGVSHLSCTSDRYNIIIYPITIPCMCSPIEAMSTGRSLGTFPVAILHCASVPVRRVSSQTRPQNCLRGCSGEAWNPTRSSVPVRRVSSQKRPHCFLRRCNEEAGAPRRSSPEDAVCRPRLAICWPLCKGFFFFEGVLTCPWPEVMGYKWR